MHLLLPWLIVAPQVLAHTEGQFPDASEVFACDFEESWDVNFDNWPDGWSRQRGPEHPHYIQIGIEETGSTAGIRALRVDMDGGAAAIFSPPVAIGALHSYVLEGSVRTEGLVYDEVHFSVRFLDKKRKTLETILSPGIRSEGTWRSLRLGPVASKDPNVHFAVIGLHVEPTAKHDLSGSVWFDNLWFAELPRMRIFTGHPFNLFSHPEAIEVNCQITGLSVPDQQVAFELQNVFGEVLNRGSEALRELAESDEPNDQSGTVTPSMDDRDGGIATWRLPSLDPGFYRVRVTMQGQSASAHQRLLTLAVIEPESRTEGEFGWSLPKGETPLSLESLAELLPQVGIHRIKFPLWYGESTSDRGEELARFVERLGESGIDVVGLLHRPPPEVQSRFGQPGELTAADLFASDSEAWLRSLEVVLLRLSMKVRWWQLGHDLDSSFVGHGNLSDTIADVRRLLAETGYDVRLGFGWDWLYETHPGGDQHWRFLSLSSDPPLNSDELGRYLAASRESGHLRWLALEPLPRDTYSLEVRAVDLIRRMTTAKIEGAESVFLPRPFDPDHGIMNGDATPGELFLPWRTAALKLAGTQYLGSLRLPGGSDNHVFAAADKAVMVIWNSKHVTEEVYLGEQIEQTDIWGNSRQPALNDNRQIIEVGPLPTFVTGVSDTIAVWRMGLSFEPSRLPSVFGKPHQLEFRFVNPLPQGISGTIRLVGPSRWLLEPSEVAFKLAANETLSQPLQITLPFNANSGRHEVRADFDVTAGRRQQWSVHRTIEVGIGDVEMEVVSRLTETGELEVEQRITNHTDESVSFNCSLFVPDRRRLRAQILDLGRGQGTQTFRLRDGDELVGQTLWLRAQEIGGQRVLSNRFKAEQ